MKKNYILDCYGEILIIITLELRFFEFLKMLFKNILVNCNFNKKINFKCVNLSPQFLTKLNQETNFLGITGNVTPEIYYRLAMKTLKTIIYNNNIN